MKHTWLITFAGKWFSKTMPNPSIFSRKQMLGRVEIVGLFFLKKKIKFLSTEEIFR